MRISVVAVLTMLPVLAGCGLPPGSHSSVVNQNYDQLGSCFGRQAEDIADDMEPVTMNRFSDINEIRVSSTLHLLWATPRPTWEMDFRAIGDQKTYITSKGVAVTGRYYWTRFEQILADCGAPGVRLNDR